MRTRLPRTAFQFLIAACTVVFFATGCNDSSSTTETTKDTAVTTQDTALMAPPPVTDTMKMDTAKTRPIVPPPDEPAK